jgi:K(+)-stimulated pyrophosphate-energized sodium pump
LKPLHVAVVSELVVVFVLCACSVIVVVSHARSLVGSTAQRRELDRMLDAVERACSDFLSHETRHLAALLGLLVLALCIPTLLWRHAHAGARLGSTVLGLLLGGAAGAALARVTHWAAARATARALAALREEPEAASSVVFRGGLLISLAVDAASTLLSCIAFLGYHRFASWGLQLEATAALQETTRAAPVVALGAIGAALVFQVGGSSFQTAASIQTAAGVSGSGARARNRRVAVDEEQNPALVAELVGDCVGGLVSRSTDVFAALTLANTALLALSGAVVRANPALAEQTALALVALPLLVRATGLLAAAIATSSLRFGPGLQPWQAFAGAGVSQALIAATGLLGAAFWLLGAPLYLPAFIAGLLGILSSLACQVLLLAPWSASSITSFRDGPVASATSLARALGLGLQRAWAPLLIAGTCLSGAFALGARTGLSRGGAYTLLLAVAGMASSGALHLCCSAFSNIGASVRRLGALRRAHYDLAARSRASELERSGLAIGNLGDIQAILCGTAAALLGALTLPLLDVSPLPLPISPASAAASTLLWSSTDSTSLAHPIVILGGILGLVSLSFYVGGVLQNNSRTASAVDDELAREQEGAPSTERDVPLLPSYRGSVLRAGRIATAALLPLAAAALLAPMVMGMVLRLVYGPEGSKLAGQGLMAVASISVLTGGCAALAARGALMALGLTRLAVDTTQPQPARSVAESARALIGHSVGPAASLGLKATVVSALVIVPLLSAPAL